MNTYPKITLDCWNHIIKFFCQIKRKFNKNTINNDNYDQQQHKPNGSIPNQDYIAKLQYNKSQKQHNSPPQLEDIDLNPQYNHNNNNQQITISNNWFFKSIRSGGEMGLGESFMRGEWDSPQLETVIEFMILNKKVQS